MSTVNVLSVSGGKDSTAMWLWAIENDIEIGAVAFADTGHEHPITYGYLDYLESKLGPIKRVKADFTEKIAHKREVVQTKWRVDLAKEKPGEWTWAGGSWVDYWDEEVEEERSRWEATEPDYSAPPVIDLYSSQKYGEWVWEPGIRALTPSEIDAVVERALSVLYPTNVPFLDLCLYKGRFPSTKQRFCTQELKIEPIESQVFAPVISSGNSLVSLQAVRRQESAARANLDQREQTVGIVYSYDVYRPLLDWTVEDVFAIHRRHGVMPNPLYEQGMSRVGCMPCINTRKDELYQIARRYPEEVERVAEWERLVRLASKRGASSLFAAANGNGNGIYDVVEWSKTGQGGHTYDLFKMTEDVPMCHSLYGLCE